MPGESDVYPIGEAVGVYRTVLNLLYRDGKERPSVIVLWDTAQQHWQGPCPFASCKGQQMHKSKIDSSTILAFQRPSPKRRRIVNFRYAIPIVRVSDGAFQRISNEGYRYLANQLPHDVASPQSFWAGFRHKYPRAWGYVMLSKIGFNSKRTEALVTVFQVCGEACRSNEIMFLKRLGKEWRVLERIPDYVQMDQTSGNLRYRGPARENPNQSQLVATGARTRSESDDAARVYRMVLDSLYSFHGEHPRAIAITEKRAYASADVPTHRSRIDSSTIASYKFYARVYDALYPRFKYRIPIAWVGDETLKSLERAGAPLAQAAAERFEYEQSPLWLAFHARYPRAWGYASLGRVGFNEGHTEALVLTQHFCGTPCVNTDTWFLRRRGERWHIVERMPRDNQAAIGIDGLRHLGPDANPAWYRSRRAHGTVTNALTGQRLPSLDVAVYQTSGDVRSMRTDSEGRYALTDLPLTGAILFKVKCPIAARFDSLYGGDFPTKPGLDTTFNIRLNYRYCLHLNRAHPLLGPVESSDTVSGGRHASPSEEAVYRGLLDAFYPPGTRENQRIMLEAVTAKACARCIEPETPRLVRKGQMDASTEKGFATVQKDPVRIRPFSGYRRKVEVMPLEDVELFVGSNKWDALKDAYPGVTSLIRFSRVGFNDSGTEALVSVRTDSAGARGIAETMLLKKIGTEWRIALRDLGREASSGEWSSGKCEATDAPDRAPDRADIQNLIGDFNIVRVGASREFRGKTDTVRIGLNALRASPRSGSMVAPVDILDDGGKPEVRVAGTLKVQGSYAVITFTQRLPEGVIQLDGWMEQYKILRTDGREFFGTWSTSSGPSVPSVGYFCSRSAAGR